MLFQLFSIGIVKSSIILLLLPIDNISFAFTTRPSLYHNKNGPKFISNSNKKMMMDYYIHGNVSPLFRKPSKWDMLDDDDFDNENTNSIDDDDDDIDDDIDNDDIEKPIITIPHDMKYVPRNIKRQHENFVAIRDVGGKDMTSDIYVRETKHDREVFWYVGKIAHISDISTDEAILRQWPIIEQHAANLRPIELYPYRGSTYVEIWSAPGDTELEVAYNRPDLLFTKHDRPDEIPTSIKTNLIGFQGEMYQGGEAGFRTWRTDDGKPARSEINPGGETRPPTQDEYDLIQKELEGKDINAIYEEQERRKEQQNE